MKQSRQQWNRQSNPSYVNIHVTDEGKSGVCSMPLYRFGRLDYLCLYSEFVIVVKIFKIAC